MDSIRRPFPAERLPPFSNVLYHLSTVKLSVLIPVYNEARTIDEVLRLVSSEPTEKEIVVVDDGSTDGTREKLAAWDGKDGVRVILHEKNMGKGGRAHGDGRFPRRARSFSSRTPTSSTTRRSIRSCCGRSRQGRADVVFGSRFRGSAENRVQNFWHTVGNRVLTLISNVVTDLNLTDMATCYKAFHRRVVPVARPRAARASASTPRSR